MSGRCVDRSTSSIATAIAMDIVSVSAIARVSARAIVRWGE